MSAFNLHPGRWQDGIGELADRSVDHAIIDPPYSAHVHSKSRSGTKRVVSKAVDLGFEHIMPVERRDLARQLARVVKRWVLVFCDLESEWLWRRSLTRAGLEVVRFGLWRKLGATPQFTGDRPATSAEAIVIAHQPGKKRWNGGGKHAEWSVPIVLERGNGTKRLHTTQKPVELMGALVRDFTDPGDLILDTHAGSGTTGVAALQSGRRFVGWEMDPDYYEAARARLANTRQQYDLEALAREAKPKQEVMFR